MILQSWLEAPLEKVFYLPESTFVSQSIYSHTLVVPKNHTWAQMSNINQTQNMKSYPYMMKFISELYLTQKHSFFRRKTSSLEIWVYVCISSVSKRSIAIKENSCGSNITHKSFDYGKKISIIIYISLIKTDRRIFLTISPSTETLPDILDVLITVWDVMW